MIYYRIDLAAQAQKFGVGVITGTRQVDLILCLNTGWAVAQHQNAVCEVHCLLDVVGYKNNGALFCLPDAGQLVLHQITCLCIQMAERLIEQHHERLIAVRTGNTDTLLHAA